MTTHEIVEWAPFQTALGVSEAQLLAASRSLQEAFLAKQRGFLRRDLLRGKEGSYVDIVYWVDRDAAQAAMKAAAESPVCHAYIQLMAGADHENPEDAVLHFDRVACYP
jgi:hypothetical protein